MDEQMTLATIVFVLNILFGHLFDMSIEAERSLKGFAYLIGASLLAGAAAYYYPISMSVLFVLGVLVVLYLMYSRNELIRVQVRLNGKMTGIYKTHGDCDIDAHILCLICKHPQSTQED